MKKMLFLMFGMMVLGTGASAMQREDEKCFAETMKTKMQEDAEFEVYERKAKDAVSKVFEREIKVGNSDEDARIIELLAKEHWSPARHFIRKILCDNKDLFAEQIKKVLKNSRELSIEEEFFIDILSADQVIGRIGVLFLEENNPFKGGFFHSFCSDSKAQEKIEQIRTDKIKKDRFGQKALQATEFSDIEIIAS